MDSQVETVLLVTLLDLSLLRSQRLHQQLQLRSPFEHIPVPAELQLALIGSGHCHDQSGAGLRGGGLVCGLPSEPSRLRPQRDLLKLLKLPDSAALVKLFRKIPPESVDRRLWPLLLTALHRPDGAPSKLIAHVPTINLGVMELILAPHIHPALTATLLEEVAADTKEAYRCQAATMIREIVVMKDELADERPLGPLKSLDRVIDLHGKVSADFQKLKTLRKLMA